jgi:hypothetical protein
VAYPSAWRNGELLTNSSNNNILERERERDIHSKNLNTSVRLEAFLIFEK